MTEVRFIDEFDSGFGWIVEETMKRTSHALVVDGRVWVVDPVDGAGVEERIHALGEPAGVLQLLDRHARDSARIADRLGVLHVPAYAGNAETPFELVQIVKRRRWREVALWWADRKVLVCADVLGTLGYFLAPGDRIGVHPLLRLVPPRRLTGLDPERILVGHGEGIHEGAADELERAIETSRKRAVGVLVGAIDARRRLRRGRDM